jgi:hypothetical protein
VTVLPHIKVYVLPSEQLQTPSVCDGLPMQPGSGLIVQPQLPPEQGFAVVHFMPFAQATAT